MKKIILVLVVLLTICPVFAQPGIVLGADLSLSAAVKPYASESVAFMYKFDRGFALDAGLRVTENILKKTKESLFYFIPFININWKIFYLGGGVVFNSDTANRVTFMAHTGFNFGNWNWGRGNGCVNIGLEVSPMLYCVEPEGNNVSSGLGSAIGTGLLSALNFIKIYAGVTYYFPF